MTPDELMLASPGSDTCHVRPLGAVLIVPFEYCAIAAHCADPEALAMLAGLHDTAIEVSVGVGGVGPPHAGSANNSADTRT
jgi:hypothetical protein